MSVSTRNTELRVVAHFTFGKIARFDVAPDQLVFWVETFVPNKNGKLVHGEKFGKWATRLQVIDRAGKVVFSKLYFKETMDEVTYSGGSYQIKIDEPAFGSDLNFVH
jgi:hypothetical protein